MCGLMYMFYSIHIYKVTSNDKIQQGLMIIYQLHRLPCRMDQKRMVYWIIDMRLAKYVLYWIFTIVSIAN